MQIRISLVRLSLVLGVVAPGAMRAQAGGTITGSVVVKEKDDEVARDVGQAVLWLENARGGRMTPDTVEIITADKEFRPSVVAVPVGSVVRFPNTDPFNHNVFSLSRSAPFDLGIYGRGETRTTSFTRPGVISVYCNVHAEMTATIIVRDNPFFTQPSGDGSFVLRNVPPGRYTLRGWHARAAEFEREIEIAERGVVNVAVELDASRYEFVQHMNKYGRPYRRRGRRY